MASVAAERTFPLILSNGPPATGTAPGGKSGLAEVAAAGVSLVRTGLAGWTAALADQQIAAQRTELDLAAAHGLRCWLWLGKLTNLPVAAGSSTERLLEEVVAGLKDHPALGAWKGHDEPAPSVSPVGLQRGFRRLKALDPEHPLVVIQAPNGTVTDLKPYAAACDITGADIYPVSYPPGKHGDSGNHDLSVVGEVTRKMVAAASGKPVWMTLQICWSGVLPPGNVPRFPTLHEERFMVYDAIINGARGLNFFGGHLTQTLRPADANAGWNWTFWTEVLRPLLAELSSTALAPALVAPPSQAPGKATANDVELVTRAPDGFLYVIAARKGAATSAVSFTGLPERIGGGEVLFEYAQDPPAPIGAGRQAFRQIEVDGGRFSDWLGPHDARVYRFPLP